MPYKEKVANILEVFNLWMFLMILSGVQVPPDDSDALMYFSIRFDECGHPGPSTSILAMLLSLALYSPIGFVLTALLVKFCLHLR